LQFRFRRRQEAAQFQRIAIGAVPVRFASTTDRPDDQVAHDEPLDTACVDAAREPAGLGHDRTPAIPRATGLGEFTEPDGRAGKMGKRCQITTLDLRSCDGTCTLEGVERRIRGASLFPKFGELQKQGQER